MPRPSARFFSTALAALILLMVPARLPGAAGLPLDKQLPEAVGIDSTLVHDCLEIIQTCGLDIHSIILIKNNALVLEAYVHPYDRALPHNLKSVTKSWLSALAGIALAKGLIPSLETRLSHAFSDYPALKADPLKKQIALHHLLTMRSGFDLGKGSGTPGRWKTSDNWVRQILDTEMAEPPGTWFRYSDANTHLFSAWLTRASGASALAFARHHLFSGLDIETPDWLTDPQGICMGGSQLYLRPVDMAKLGLVYLNQGRYKGAQLVPAAWVKQSVSWHTGTHLPRGYGYWWWRTEKNDGFAALGWGGQRIAVYPDRQMVLVITAGNSGHADFIQTTLSRGILPSDTALPENPGGTTALDRLVRQLADPAPRPSALPKLASHISGRIYRLDPNPLKLARVSFDFSGVGQAVLTLDLDDRGSVTIPAGTDGRYRMSEASGFGHNRKKGWIAARCEWQGNALAVEMMPLGEPLKHLCRLTFPGHRLNGMTTLLPVGSHVHLRGRADRSRDRQE